MYFDPEAQQKAAVKFCPHGMHGAIIILDHSFFYFITSLNEFLSTYIFHMFSAKSLDVYASYLRY